MQWQHGSYTKNANGSLSLEPISVDGRQLLSTPCASANSVFTRYNQPELIKVRQMDTLQIKYIYPRGITTNTQTHSHTKS